MGSTYIYLIAVIAFILPLALRKYFIAIQAVMAFVWTIALFFNLANGFHESDLQIVMIIFLPIWIFSSLIALEVRSKF